MVKSKIAQNENRVHLGLIKLAARWCISKVAFLGRKIFLFFALAPSISEYQSWKGVQMKAKGQSFNLSPIFLESERSQGVKQQFVNNCKQIAYS